MVERVVNDIDEIVRIVRFEGRQTTHAGEREVRNALRKTIFKYKLHQDQELFDRAYGYTRTYPLSSGPARGLPAPGRSANLRQGGVRPVVSRASRLEPACPTAAVARVTRRLAAKQ